MGYKVMADVWQHQDVAGSELILLLAMADSADNNTRECYLSQASLAEMARCSVRHVPRLLKLLEGKGLIEDAGIRHARFKTKVWRVLPDKMSGGSPDVPDIPQDIPQDIRPDIQVSDKQVNKRTKNKTLAAGKPPRKRDLLFEALAEVCGLDYTKLTRTERGRLNKALKDLREVDATPDLVRARAKEYAKKWPDIDLTPTALASNWNQLQSKQELRVEAPKCPHCLQELGERHSDITCQLFREAEDG